MTNVVLEQTFEALESEEHAVRLWRREQFGLLGFDPFVARLLAESPADLGQARTLRRAGCPIDIAFRILA
jgi:hypothetical protein